MRRDLLIVIWAGGVEPARKSAASGILPSLLGRSAREFVLDSASGLKPAKITLLGEAGEKRATRAADVILTAKSHFKNFKKEKRGQVLLIDARFPLLSAPTLRTLLKRHQKEENALTRLSWQGEEPAMAVEFAVLVRAARDLAGRPESSGFLNEFRLALAGKAGLTGTVELKRPEEALTLDLPDGVARILQALRVRKIRRLQRGGTIILDPASTWIDWDTRIGRGTVIYPSVVIEGRSRIGKQCRIYPFVHLIDTRVGDGARILSSTMLEGSVVEAAAQVGPFTHFRPNTLVRSRAKVGNFVEMKNTVFGRGSKAGHLSYLGDCQIEDDVNIGAGTITCNYDGFKKSRTIIERGAFIGSGTELVAPVRVGRNAYVGAGSTITKNVSPEALAVARCRQIEKRGWARRRLRK
jgi:bifunctional UDP-N-acetylglucosamine pyrophosphorylase/glucosamine-1-phosphate N-acetyltransferase